MHVQHQGSLYGDAKTAYTVGSIVNSINYENEWAWPWKSAGERQFSDSQKAPFLEAEGLMPYYENEAFAAVAALFKVTKLWMEDITNILKIRLTLFLFTMHRAELVALYS